MSRRWFALTIGLVASTAVISVAWGQSTTRQPSLAERMSAMRRSWSQPGTASTADSAEVAEPAERGAQGSATRSESRSIWPNFLGRRTEQRSAPSANRSATGRPGTSSPATRTAGRPRAGSVQSDSSSTGTYALPGLGGSPLPQAQSAASRHGSAGGPDISHEIASDFVLGRSTTSDEGSSERNSDNTMSGATNARAPRTTAIRQSPPRRSAPKVDPEELRRELAGSYPAPATRGGPTEGGPVARTARANTGAANKGATESTAEEPDKSNAALEEAALEPTVPEPMDSTPRLPAEESKPLRISETAAGPTTDSIKSQAADDSNPWDLEPPRETSPPARESAPPARDFGSAFREERSIRPPRELPQPAAPPINRGAASFAPPRTATELEAGVLVSNQTPIITTDIRGPKQILIGREASYRIQLRNQGDIPAEGLVASIRIPSWAEVVDKAATQGTILQAGNASGSGHLEWQLPRLEARGGETLDIRLIPRASRPLELGVSWTITPVGSRALVEVQEPKLQMSVSGPDEVLFAQPQIFRLTLTNPGTGVAANVKIDLMPPGGGEKVVTTQPIGDLAPGASKTVEVELTPKEAGKLFVKAAAAADGGLSCDASKEIFCRKPELEVDWRGPETKYAGTPATYFFRVRNPGTAAAENVTVRVTLPEGAEYASASEGQSYDSKRGEVAWHVGTLNPGDDNYMELKCIVKTPGVNQFRVTAAASSGDLADSKVCETNVVALADLELDVTDPSGPIAVGDSAIYELRVHNRGATAAKAVNIVALFSEGLEPDQVEGGMYTVADGRVTFRTIDELQAGRDIVLRIRARASKAGTHVFRAEVLCQDLEIKLAAEETTRFYADEAASEGGEPAESSASASAGFEAATR